MATSGELAAVLGKFVEGSMRISEYTLILRASPAAVLGTFLGFAIKVPICVPHVATGCPHPGATAVHGSCAIPAEDGRVMGFCGSCCRFSTPGAGRTERVVITGVAPASSFGAYAALAQTDLNARRILFRKSYGLRDARYFRDGCATAANVTTSSREGCGA